MAYLATLRQASVRAVARPTSTRFFSISALRNGTSEGDGAAHLHERLNKGNTHDVQATSAKRTQETQKKGEAGSAVHEKDSTGAVSKAKQEHPEAPDPAIGMQDERGGRNA